MEDNKSIDEILASLDPEVRKTVQRGSEVVPVTPGYLTSRDVCRLWAGPEWSEPYMDGPNSKARQLRADLDLPLFEVKPGIWQVAHTVSTVRSA